MTKTDYRLLEGLADADIFTVQTPSIMAYNLDVSRQHVSRRLNKLMEAGYVERVEKGKYRITSEGVSYITEE